MRAWARRSTPKPRTWQLAGRVMSLRGPFADISDRTGRFQLYFAKKELGDAFALLKSLDRGDFLGARGFVFRTKMGDLALHVQLVRGAEQRPGAAARQVARFGRHREALSPALRRPDRQPARARRLHAAQPDHRRDAPLHRRAGLLRVRDADAAQRRRRRGRAAVPHPRQRARHRDDAAHRDRTEPQALDRRRPRARVRDRPDLPQRRHRHDAQPRVHDARTLRGVLVGARDDGVQRSADGASGRRACTAATR